MRTELGELAGLIRITEKELEDDPNSYAAQLNLWSLRKRYEQVCDDNHRADNDGAISSFADNTGPYFETPPSHANSNND